MSPIAFDEEEEDDRQHTAPYQQALHDSMGMEHSFSRNERSALLSAKVIQPLRDGPPPRLQTKRRPRLKSTCDWGVLVCATAGIHLASIALHDLYLLYLSHRLGYSSDVEHWNLPWLSPSKPVLSRFGAFVPCRLLFQRQWWRMLTCALTCTSVVEWITILGDWYIIRFGGITAMNMSCWIYLLSVLTGQIWMMAWDVNGLSGCATWGTCGVLSASSCATPRQRFLLLSASTAMLVLALFQPTNSFVGTMGATFFGWAFCGVMTGIDKDDGIEPRGPMRFLFAFIVLTLWIVPLLCIAFREPVTERAFSNLAPGVN